MLVFFEPGAPFGVVAAEHALEHDAQVDLHWQRLVADAQLIVLIGAEEVASAAPRWLEGPRSQTPSTGTSVAPDLLSDDLIDSVPVSAGCPWRERSAQPHRRTHRVSCPP